MTPNQEMFVYWIKERYSILEKREKGSPKPWTKDHVFQTTYFCNVDREDDKVTKWIRNNWKYSSGEWGGAAAYVFSMCVARIFNLPSTLELIGKPEKREEIPEWVDTTWDTLHQHKEDGNKLWNGAYIVSTNGKKMDKLDYCIELFVEWENSTHIGEAATATTLKDMHSELMKLEGLASFLAAQVVADVKNTPWFKENKKYPDWKTFSAYGPGSLRGLTWFWEKKINAKDYQAAILKAYEKIELELPFYIQKKLCMQNLQNCFCEYDKYMRVLNGTGRSKRRYTGI